MAFDSQSFLAQRPDLAANWQRAQDPNWLAQHPEDAATINQIKQYGSLDAYAQAQAGGGADSDQAASGGSQQPTTGLWTGPTGQTQTDQSAAPVATTNPIGTTGGNMGGFSSLVNDQSGNLTPQTNAEGGWTLNPTPPAGGWVTTGPATPTGTGTGTTVTGGGSTGGGLTPTPPAGGWTTTGPTTPTNLPAGPTPGAGQTTPGGPSIPTPGYTPPAATGGGTKSYSQLLSQYKDEHPGMPAPSGDEFNAWATSKGISSWTNDPAGTPNVYTTAAAGTGPSNYNQTQQGSQAGAFNTTGTTSQNQTQTSGGTSSQQNQQSSTGTTTGATTGTSTQNQNQQQTGGAATTMTGGTTGTTTGTSTTGVVDPLGFGGLLQGAQGTAKANDATRNAFLSDLVNTGGSAMNSQFDQAIRNSQSGPSISGAGESAQARAAGYAGAQIARQNTDQRLAAAGQLAGPTATTQLSTAANPFLGQTMATGGTSTGTQTGSTNATNFSNLLSQATGATTGTQTGTNTNNTTGSQNAQNTGFSSLVGNTTQGQSGTATGSSGQTASGQIPQAQQVSTGGGGCIICTVGIHHGLWRNKRILRRAVRHKTSSPRFANAIAGYFLLFTPIARLALRSRTLARFTMPVARCVVYEELRVSGRRLPFRSLPWTLHWSWHGVCSLAGRLPGVRRDLTDGKIVTLAKKHEVFFPLVSSAPTSTTK